MENSEPPPGKRWTIRKAAIGGFVGVVPGLLCWYGGWGPAGGGILFPVLIGLAGAFVGVTLTRPDVSARRVLKWTAILTVAKAIPGPMRKRIYDEARRERDTLEEPPPSPANAVSEGREKGNGRNC